VDLFTHLAGLTNSRLHKLPELPPYLSVAKNRTDEKCDQPKREDETLRQNIAQTLEAYFRCEYTLRPL
ncbi:hypothetical protein BgiBS90_033042, partial [Biomphalaria glabrata]